MKRKTYIIVVALIILVCMGCTSKTPLRMYNKNYKIVPEDYSDTNDYIEVVDASIEEGLVIVKLHVNLEKFSFKECSRIYIVKEEVGNDMVFLDVGKTNEYNSEDIFETKIRDDDIYLVFSDESIIDKTLERYVLWIEYPSADNPGICRSIPVCLQ